MSCRYVVLAGGVAFLALAAGCSSTTPDRTARMEGSRVEGARMTEVVPGRNEAAGLFCAAPVIPELSLPPVVPWYYRGRVSIGMVYMIPSDSEEVEEGMTVDARYTFELTSKVWVQASCGYYHAETTSEERDPIAGVPVLFNFMFGQDTPDLPWHWYFGGGGGYFFYGDESCDAGGLVDNEWVVNAFGGLEMRNHRGHVDFRLEAGHIWQFESDLDQWTLAGVLTFTY